MKIKNIKIKTCLVVLILFHVLFLLQETIATADELTHAFDSDQPDNLPLVERQVIFDDIAANDIFPKFGSWTGGSGKDLFLGFRMMGSAKESDTRGRLRVYRNQGGDADPRYEEGFWLDTVVPSARIPSG